MERTTRIIRAKEIMGQNFIGASELSDIAEKMGIVDPVIMNMPIPEIPFSTWVLKKRAKDYLLILGIPLTSKNEMLTIEKMCLFFGTDPLVREPCFYNQDWYMNEDFATKETLDPGWHLIKKKVFENSRGMKPDDFLSENDKENRLPTAILCAFSFFAWYFHTNGEILWQHDYIWCRDKDFHGDQIYVGRYSDISGLTKSGFSIHRHLHIKNCYGVITEV
jgi:hypothetical protein